MAIDDRTARPTAADGMAVAAESSIDSAEAPAALRRWPQRVGALLSERWLALVALPLVFGIYVRAVGFATVYDDNVATPWHSLGDVPKFFTHDIFGFDGIAHSVYYRPMAMTWSLLVHLVSGDAPGWLHLSAILLHVMVIVLAYVFGRHLFGDERLATLTALLFALHPSKVESVAWIGSSCVDGLGAVFFFSSLIAFFKWRQTARWLAVSVLLFTGAMFTKETMVLVPMLIAVYLWLTLPRDGRYWRILKTLLPYGVVWIVYMAIRHEVIRPVGASAEYIRPTFTLANLWTAPYAIWWYIRHLALPWGLSVEYATAILERPTFYGFVLPGVGLLLLLAVVLWLWRLQCSKVAAFLMFWFIATLAPAVIVAPMVSLHDRYLYLPSYAFCALVAWAVLYLGKLPAAARLAIAVCVVALWSGLTWHEMSYWDSEETLWSRAHEIAPSNLRAQMALASIYNEDGDAAKALSILDDGLRYSPNAPNLLLARASILQADKKYDDARAEYLRVLQLTEPAARQPVEGGTTSRFRAIAVHGLTLLDFSTGNFAEAEHYARVALSLNFTGMNYHAALARSLREQGRVKEANAEDALEWQLRSQRR